jgi:hypothetical protein
MKVSTILKQGLLGLAVIPAIILGVGSTVSAAQIPYVPGQPLPSPTTPAFNIYTNIPYGYGDESDFVRVRPSTGNPTDAGENGVRNTLYISTLNAACNVDDMYDVRTYIHNGADEESNDNGNGTAVAHGVAVAMTAPIGAKNKSFVFGSTVSANNASTINDNGTLNCGDKEVVLELVPNTVNVYAKSLGWKPASQSAVNGSMNIGSEVFGSGDVWACWDEIVLVAYTVKVNAVPTPPVTPPTTPKVLPSTGAGSMLAAFGVTSVLGALVYRNRALRADR